MRSPRASNDRLPGTGVTLAADEPFRRALWKLVESAGFALVTLGFALQLPAACNAHFDQEPADVHQSLDRGPQFACSAKPALR
jgi:hypothetical protein